MEESVTPPLTTPTVPLPLTKKQELNNYIVLMRKTIRKSKVHLINKLVREAKRLKERKGPEKAREKSQRKANRLLEEIAALKHLKEDRVSIFALQDKKSLQETLSGTDVTSEIRALAKLGNHQFVQVDVLKYREKNPHWDLQIPVLLEKTKQKEKKSQKKQEKKEKEQQIKLEPDGESSNIVSFEDDDECEVTDFSFTNTETSNSKAKRTSTKIKSAEKDLIKNFQTVDRSDGTVKIQHLKDLADLEDKPFKVKITTDPEECVSELVDAIQKRPRSSFFIGGTEEEPEEDYRRDQEVEKSLFSDRKQRNIPNSEPRAIFRKGKLVNKPGKSFGRGHKESTSSSRTPRYFDNKSEPKRRDYNYHPTSTSKRDSEPYSSGEKLHPSWEAKKRQAKASILPSFQGKKIAFKDDD